MDVLNFADSVGEWRAVMSKPVAEQAMRAVDQREYRDGMTCGARDARCGSYRPQDFTDQPDDFRQGYVDGWEETRDALGLRG